MTTGATNCLSGVNPALEASLSAADSAKPSVLHAFDEMTADLSNHLSNDASNVDPNTEAGLADSPDGNADSWRTEVAARLERYRTRRKPRSPRYPSLLLPFDAPESWSRHSTAIEPASLPAPPARSEKEFAFQSSAASAQLIEQDFAPFPQPSEPAPPPLLPRYTEQQPSSNVIEFPRSAAIPVFHPSDLADPVFDRNRPRIVEVPEILPPPPALGGMLIEPARRDSPERQARLVLSHSASIAQRAFAALVDGVILTAALTAFTTIFFRVNPAREPLKLIAVALAVAAVTLWAGYEFLFVVYTGSTPGLRAARLRLASFDGSPLVRRVRRARVLASLLSALSLALGYLWCFLDPDGLCWHDRITHTHLQRITPPAEPASN
jgi:uncharacterized RDD family membrane protein YckC